MTAREIERIQNAIRHIESSLDVDPWAMKIAVEAMKKQIPMEPIVDIDTYLCPVCKMPVEYQTMLGDSILYHGNYDFCPYCGQKILWGEGES